MDYLTENLVGGEIRTDTKAIAAGTYYKGQLLGRVTATNVYAAWDSSKSDGTENIKAVCMKSQTLAAVGKLPVYIAGTEVQARGLVKADGTALSVTDAIVENAQDSNILIKRG